jgi:predicted regulator of Ras-like GTPase activity (Roadblock/LC7/MglB family)
VPKSLVSVGGEEWNALHDFNRDDSKAKAPRIVFDALRREGLTMTRADQLAAALDDFLAVSPEVEAAAVVSADGLPMASALPPHVEEDRLAAMGAALLTLGERAAAGLGKGDLAQVFVEADQGYVVLMAAGAHAVLVAVTSHSAKVGLVLFEMRKSARRVAEVMAGPAATDPGALPGNGLVSAPGSPAPVQTADFPASPLPATPEPDPLDPGSAPPTDSTFSTWH